MPNPTGVPLIDVMQRGHQAFRNRAARESLEQVLPEIEALADQGEYLAAMEAAIRQRFEIGQMHNPEAANEAVRPLMRKLRGLVTVEELQRRQQLQGGRLSLVDLAMMQPGADIGKVGQAEALIGKYGAQAWKAGEEAITARDIRPYEITAQHWLGQQRKAKTRDIMAEYAGRAGERRKTREEIAKLRMERRAGGKPMTEAQFTAEWRKSFENLQGSLDQQQSLAGLADPQAVEQGAQAAIHMLNGLRDRAPASVQQRLPKLEARETGGGISPITGQPAPGRIILWPEGRPLPSADELAQTEQPQPTIAAQASPPPTSQPTPQMGGMAAQAMPGGPPPQMPAGQESLLDTLRGGQAAAPAGTTGAALPAMQLPPAQAPEFAPTFGQAPQQPRPAPPSVIPELANMPQTAQLIQQAVQAGQTITKSQIRASLLADGVADRSQQDQILGRFPWGQ